MLYKFWKDESNESDHKEYWCQSPKKNLYSNPISISKGFSYKFTSKFAVHPPVKPSIKLNPNSKVVSKNLPSQYTSADTNKLTPTYPVRLAYP